MSKERDLIAFCRGLFSTSNLIGTDFAEVAIHGVEHAFAQDARGVHVSFLVSNHAIGKADGTAIDALARLAPDR